MPVLTMAPERALCWRGRPATRARLVRSEVVLTPSRPADGVQADEPRGEADSATTPPSHLFSRSDAATWRLVWRAALVGLVAGALVALYRMVIRWGLVAASHLYDAVREHPVLVVPWLAGAVVAGFVVAEGVRRFPAASGSGIPQVKGIVQHGLRVRAAGVLVVRFVGGALGALAGLSLGREGPTVQIGAAAAQGVSRVTRAARADQDHLIGAGAAAGLSAAFNAPLSGMVFALEEVHRTFSARVVLAATTAALTADVLSSVVFGLQPVLGFGVVPSLPLAQYGWLLLLGPVAGAVGTGMNGALLGVQTLYRSWLPARWRPVATLVVALPFGLWLPQVLGGGDDLVRRSEAATGGLTFFLLLLTAKALLTSTSFGSGFPGGIFMPMLAVGALTGTTFALAFRGAGLPSADVAAFAVCAMAGVLAAAVRAPVTSILLVTELSGGVEHTLPVAACVLLAMLTASVLRGEPIYDVLLRRFLANGSGTLEFDDGSALVARATG